MLEVWNTKIYFMEGITELATQTKLKLNIFCPQNWFKSGFGILHKDFSNKCL